MFFKKRIVVLRLGHRLQRDKRVSTHVGLVARAFGANKIVFAGIVEESVYETLKKVCEDWGDDFGVETVTNPLSFMRQCKRNGFRIVHLTMYGENIQLSNVLDRIIKENADILIVIGAEKVPAEVYKIADYNVAIGNQPHSEIAALAVFLDRLFRGEELAKEFINARYRIVPSKRYKNVVRMGVGNES
ncbi:MAG: tRNA (cytidine(56)-2'-O)-methyltransferase [Thermoproteales archaeon]|nr:tRNA (cytidine(56)-2'-O)-methyltransferase [Thermoproteales archaeon]